VLDLLFCIMRSKYCGDLTVSVPCFRCRSYYSAEGCAGSAAQYDLISERCSVYGYPIGATGTFTCDALGRVLIFAVRLKLSLQVDRWH
jgi:hypothetical protein